MKAIGFVLSIALIPLSTLAFAASEAAQGPFDKMKNLAGAWEGSLTTVPVEPKVAGKSVQVSIRVTSSGNAILHEMKIADQPDNPITMFYVEGERLLLTHYCDAGNRPHMAAKMAPGDKTLDFEFVGLSGSTKPGYMHHVSFTALAPDHHVEEWTFLVEGKGPMRARFDLQRKK